MPLLLLLLVCLGLSLCVPSLSSQPPPAKLTAGFWVWHYSGNAMPLADPVDVLFVLVGNIRAGHAYAALPTELPQAKEYWVVLRMDEPGLPSSQIASLIGEEIQWLRREAKYRGLNVVGVQLDIDSPTAALPQYAAFLRETRKALPPGFQLSITALLDWFRSGTGVAEVVAAVDEFVPQFYDLGERDVAIAAKIDAVRWGLVFNRFRKRFRIGISTFGRARMVRPQGGETYFFRDLSPLDIAANPAFQLKAGRNPANELVLTYEASRKTSISYNRFESGNAIEFILATPESVRAAAASARQMGGHLAGVVFFRWPYSETLVMQPEEVLSAAGFGPDRTAQNRVHTVDGGCAAVECVDVYLESASPLSPSPLRYRIRSSSELEYFLPKERMPVRMAGTSEIEVSLPPYCGRGRLLLGRAVSAKPVKFTVEEER